MKIKLLIGFIITFLGVSCSSGDKDADLPEQLSASNSTCCSEPDSVIQVSFSSNDSALYRTIVSFYSWYIEYEASEGDTTKIKHVYFTADSMGVHSLTNVDTYLDALKSLHTVSPKFIEKERKRFADCDCYLKTFDWSHYENTYDFDETPCGFFTHNYWFRSMEGADSVIVTSFHKNKSNDSCWVELGFLEQGYKQGFSSSELIVKSKAGWIIDDVECNN